MPRASAIAAAAATLACLLSGCMLTERGEPRIVSPIIAPRPASPQVEAVPQPEGPPLQCEGETFEGPGELLARYQALRAELDKANKSNEELQARLRVASQRVAALEALETEHRRQMGQLTAERDGSKVAAGKAQTELRKAHTTLAALKTRVAELEEAAPEVGQLREQVAERTAQWQEAERKAKALKRQVLQAELARVKAEQRLVALQIVMARQQAIFKQRTETPVVPDTASRK